jgi:hypothetical protein
MESGGPRTLKRSSFSRNSFSACLRAEISSIRLTTSQPGRASPYGDDAYRQHSEMNTLDITGDQFQTDTDQAAAVAS